MHNTKISIGFLSSALGFLKEGVIKGKGLQYPNLVTHTVCETVSGCPEQTVYVLRWRLYYGSSHEDSMASKRHSNPCTGLDRPWGLQEVEAPRISKQSAPTVVSPTHRPPLPPGNIPGTHFC